MSAWKSVFFMYLLMTIGTVSAYAVPGVEVNGILNLSGTGTISFPDGSNQTTASTDCTQRYELNSNALYPNGEGTVTDCRTGLIWLKNANCLGTGSGWAAAKTWAAGLGDGSCGLHDGSSAGDWRLPTKTEWMAMVQSARKHNFTGPALTDAAGTGHWAAGDIFDNVQLYGYWSSTPGADPAVAWGVDMSSDGNTGTTSVSNPFFVWPVRAAR